MAKSFKRRMLGGALAFNALFEGKPISQGGEGRSLNTGLASTIAGQDVGGVAEFGKALLNPSGPRGSRPSGASGRRPLFNEATFFEDRLADREIPDPIPADIIPEDPLLTQATSLAESYMLGEIPDDVAKQVRQQAAFQANQGGVAGQLAGNLEARDLGRTSLQLQEKGISTALAIGDQNLRREMFNEDLELKVNAFNESVREWEDRFATMVREGDLAENQLDLHGAELLLKSQQFVQAGINDLIISNSRYAIDNVQENINSLQEFFTPTDEFIRGLI